ncbi:hypothetical protein B9Z55_012278 [Caenorhabditis nigoni]|uniref:F-box domain-containing protein n=1 Tax=Caenorhabditis nigoni TaxID=1611254 RepID=A0A2G5TWL1_9PELO|nr:hypothetical protein B9Z55_012278 [Caenorhabditis nigoni]
MKFLETALACWQFNIKNKASKHRFPLLKLPRVVLLECIENLDVLEIIVFSLLSKRAKSITKLIRWNPLKIRLLNDVDGTVNICLGLSTHPGLRWIIEYTNDDKSSKYPYLQTYLFGPKVNHFLGQWYDRNAIENSKQMTEHICEVFRSPISFIQIAKESLIEWIIEFQPTIPHVWICNSVILSADTLDRISKSLKVTEHFGFKSIGADEKIPFTEPIPYRSITIDNSHLVALSSILNGTNSNILLYNSKLTPMDINSILKEWQKGTKLRNLEFFEIQTFTQLDTVECTREIFKDLNYTVSFGNDGRPMTVIIDDDYHITLPEVEMVLNLTRSDGTILSIFGHYGVSEDEKTKIFLDLQVWRKQA